ncbi:MAG TPA: M56 family metallopeptidase [Candidatus Sulfotelmatobacter sp.]|nr:M56 family metallopeptidase [Candidatus Sulfotelmatobacter sp.]
MTPALHAIAQVTALRAVDSIIEGTFVALFAAALLRAARRHNAGARFAISFSALLAIAFLPFLNMSRHSGISATSHAAFTISESWALYLFTAWALIATSSLIRLGRAALHLRVLRNGCEPVDLQHLDPLLQETLRRHSEKRKFTLCTSDAVRVPTALGLLKPAVVIPRWIMQELSPAELNQILVHELAHLNRWDDWTNLAQQLVRAVFFFHPAIWWIERRIALEREMACDDAVLLETASPRAYAECLARLAERSFARRTVALAQAALGRIRQTSLRIAQILSAERTVPNTRSWKPAASLVAGFAVMCALGISRAPRLVAFQDSLPNHPPAVTANGVGVVPNVSALNARVPSAPVVQAKLNTRVGRSMVKVPVMPVNVRSDRPKSARNTMVHLASSKTRSAPATETFFFVIQSGNSASGDEVYQIQMWRFTVLHSAVDPNSKSPHRT